MKKLLLTLMAFVVVGFGSKAVAMNLPGDIPTGSTAPTLSANAKNSVHVYATKVIDLNQQTGWLGVNANTAIPFDSPLQPTGTSWTISNQNTLVAPAAGTYKIDYYILGSMPKATESQFAGSGIWEWINVNGKQVPGSLSGQAIYNFGSPAVSISRSILVYLHKGDKVQLQAAQSGSAGADVNAGITLGGAAVPVSASLTITQI
jgi:hypothetical protein